MTKKLIDANYILRYFLNDNAEQNKIATQIIENSYVIILNEVIAEVCYVLEKIYSIPKEEIASLLTKFLEYDNILSNYNLLRYTLKIYSENNLDFVDSLLIANNHLYNYEIFTFDKKLNKQLK